MPANKGFYTRRRVDKNQTELIKTLERHSMTVVPLELRHSRTLGGGFHCVTLDLFREHQ